MIASRSFKNQLNSFGFWIKTLIRRGQETLIHSFTPELEPVLEDLLGPNLSIEKNQYLQRLVWLRKPLLILTRLVMGLASLSLLVDFDGYLLLWWVLKLGIALALTGLFLGLRPQMLPVLKRKIRRWSQESLTRPKRLILLKIILTLLVLAEFIQAVLGVDRFLFPKQVKRMIGILRCWLWQGLKRGFGSFRRLLTRTLILWKAIVSIISSPPFMHNHIPKPQENSLAVFLL
ncbi:MAG: hypothetical protein AAFU64_05800 [Bacteroidota bacterium]